MDKRVALYEVEDWYGLYIDGALVLEGHSLGASELMRVLRLGEYTYLGDDTDNLAASGGRMPQTEDEVRAAYL